MYIELYLQVKLLWSLTCTGFHNLHSGHNEFFIKYDDNTTNLTCL